MFDIDLQSRTPIYEQLYKRVVELTVKKQLRPNDRLPSVRELAKELGVNPNTVSKAFQNLERDGIIYSLAGRGSFISDKNGDIIKQNAADNFKTAAKEAMTAGLSSDEMTEIVNKVFQDRGITN